MMNNLNRTFVWYIIYTKQIVKEKTNNNTRGIDAPSLMHKTLVC